MAGLSLEQAGIRSKLSGETIRKMKGGKVPEPQTLRAFAEGFKDRGADLHELMVICGYEVPDDPIEYMVNAYRDRYPESIDQLAAAMRDMLKELEEAKRSDANKGGDVL
jgi:hypothetical protein